MNAFYGRRKNASKNGKQTIVMQRLHLQNASLLSGDPCVMSLVQTTHEGPSPKNAFVVALFGCTVNLLVTKHKKMANRASSTLWLLLAVCCLYNGIALACSTQQTLNTLTSALKARDFATLSAQFVKGSGILQVPGEESGSAFPYGSFQGPDAIASFFAKFATQFKLEHYSVLYTISGSEYRRVQISNMGVRSITTGEYIAFMMLNDFSFDALLYVKVVLS